MERFLSWLVTLDPLERALVLAPADDEPDHDDEDGGLTESLRSIERGEGIATEELKRELGIDAETSARHIYTRTRRSDA